MTTLAVTGHLDLTETAAPLIRTALDALLSRYAADGALVGVTCLAEGADALFAEATLSAGGRLVVLVPSQDYRATVVRPDYAPLFDRLIDAAEEVHVLPHERADLQAYESANTALLERADHLIAIWNGEPPTGRGGGTADVVLEARAAGIPVDVVWPEGAARHGG